MLETQFVFPFGFGKTILINPSLSIESHGFPSQAEQSFAHKVGNWFESKPGGIRKEPPIGNHRKELSDEKLPHILIVDDDEINTYILVRTINSLKRPFICSTASNGMDGLNMLREFGEEYMMYPDLILLDLEMPILDGFQFLEKYQNDFLDALSQTEIMVVTSSSLNVDKKAVLAYDFVSDFIPKPFPISLLNSY